MVKGGRARDPREAALDDPVRSSGGLHEANRLYRGVSEFLRVPLLMTAAFCAAAVLVSVLDAVAGAPNPVRSVAEAVVIGKNANSFIATVAASLLTVTSITFSMLLVAVQQTASSLTPVVFDQFLRRRANQVYFGSFVGVTAFTFIVLGLARDDPAPVYGAVITLVLTIAALVLLLMLIHSTVDQMRPQSVTRSIHELALRARERELVLLGRTRPERRTPEGTPERVVRLLDSGYVVSIDFEKLGRIARDIGDGGEVIVEGRLGDYVIFDAPLARLVGADPDDDRIAWATGTSAAQSPNTATIAIRMLRDLCGRWLISGERDRSERSARQDELPVVYVDGAVSRIIDALATLVIGSAESRQAQTCAELLHAFADLAPRLRSRSDREAFSAALHGALPGVIQQAELPRLRHALGSLEQALDDAGHDASRVQEVRELLTESTRRLLPKASDEPEAAHPG